MKLRTDRRLFVAAAGAICTIATLRPAWGQTGRPLTIIVPQPAGNPSDAIARNMQPLLQRELGQPVIVENVPGAGGAIGVQRLLNGPADGHTAVFVSQTEPILTPLAVASARYRAADLRPIGTVGRTSYVLAGRTGLSARSYAELVAEGRKGATRLSYGHIGQGSMIHLMGEQWSRLSGVPLLHVPYKGVPPLVQDLLGGQIDLSFVPLGGMAMNLIGTGKLRVYGLSAAKPIALLPGVAPLATTDPSLKDFVHDAWGAILVPATTPRAPVERLHRAFSVAMKDAEVLAFLRSNGIDPQAPLTLDELDGFYARETRLYQQLARSIGVIAE